MRHLKHSYESTPLSAVHSERRDPIRVLVIDGSVITLHGVRALLEKNGRIVVVATAGTEAEAIAALQTCRPDVVVMDVQVGSVRGIDIANTIRESHPDVRIVFFSTYDDPHLLHTAVLAGVHGYLTKTASGEVLAKSIEAAHAGQAMIDDRLTTQVLQWVRDGVRTGPHATLEGCPEEDLRLLSHVAAGKTNKEIAQALHIEPRAVAARLQRIYKRLRISRRSEAASSFTKHKLGLVSGPHRHARYATSASGH
ncbi:MAG: response regulator transcription factor [Nitrospiraceae bacterium]